MSRVFLLHGYLESPAIFDSLRPLLPAGADVRSWELEAEFADWQPAGRPDVGSLARHLARKHDIGPADVLLGHSMGGWIAIHLKQLTGARAVLLSSFTDQRKIVSDVRHPTLLTLYAWSGLMQSRFMRQRYRRDYRRDESRALHTELIEGLPGFRRRYLHQQLQVVFAPAPPLTVQPELRVHARRDNVIRPPDEPYVEVPGDHFALVFYPQQTADAILKVMG